ncbi:hypothetical protein JG688_00012067 [Phytophthora aleatoria]|uniref:Fe2OG dioxygenase domain-containing protein n=1 Tax=Phytophthora aleatoria TaxID=2496075 RepID=A0A8J5IFV7_9STRA|nr:hypothetical protein JG688_00012067 [Phytophthora aleatoria]
MIATLVVQPPSLHEGGDLVVYRDGEEKHRHDFGKAAGTATYLTHYAVHYADAEHAVEKVTKGYRLALVYSEPSKESIARDFLRWRKRALLCLRIKSCSFTSYNSFMKCTSTPALETSEIGKRNETDVLRKRRGMVLMAGVLVVAPGRSSSTSSIQSGKPFHRFGRSRTEAATCTARRTDERDDVPAIRDCCLARGG